MAGTALRAELAFNDAFEAVSRALDLLPRRHRRERLDLAFAAAELCDHGGGRMRREVLIEAIALARRLGDDDALLRCVLIGAGLSWGIADSDEADGWIDEAERLTNDRPDVRDLGEVHYRRGVVRMLAGRLQEGQEQFEAALGLLDGDVDRQLRGRVLKGLGSAMLRMGKAAETVGWLEEALAEYTAAGDTIRELSFAEMLLIAYHEIGHWDLLAASAERYLAPDASGPRPTPGSAVRRSVS